MGYSYKWVLVRRDVPAAVVGRMIEVVPRSVGHVNARAVRSRAHLDGPAGHSDCRACSTSGKRQILAVPVSQRTAPRPRAPAQRGRAPGRCTRPAPATSPGARSGRSARAAGRRRTSGVNDSSPTTEWSSANARRQVARTSVLRLTATGGHLVLAVDRVGDHLGVHRRRRVGVRRPRQPAEERQPQHHGGRDEEPAPPGGGEPYRSARCPASSPDKRDT